MRRGTPSRKLPKTSWRCSTAKAQQKQVTAVSSFGPVPHIFHLLVFYSSAVSLQCFLLAFHPPGWNCSLKICFRVSLFFYYLRIIILFFSYSPPSPEYSMLLHEIYCFSTWQCGKQRLYHVWLVVIQCRLILRSHFCHYPPSIFLFEYCTFRSPPPPI